jgi:hypothetical protein
VTTRDIAAEFGATCRRTAAAAGEFVAAWKAHTSSPASTAERDRLWREADEEAQRTAPAPPGTLRVHLRAQGAQDT